MLAIHYLFRAYHYNRIMVRRQSAVLRDTARWDIAQLCRRHYDSGYELWGAINFYFVFNIPRSLLLLRFCGRFLFVAAIYKFKFWCILVNQLHVHINVNLGIIFDIQHLIFNFDIINHNHFDLNIPFIFINHINGCNKRRNQWCYKCCNKRRYGTASRHLHVHNPCRDIRVPLWALQLHRGDIPVMLML